MFHPDVPELVETRGAPSTHIFLGHVPWSPPLPLPDTSAFDEQLPTVYVTLGSSGPADRLPVVLRALASMPVNVLVSTAGRGAAIPRGFRLAGAPFVPGDLAAARASVVVSNGGASTAYQALAAGSAGARNRRQPRPLLRHDGDRGTRRGLLLRSGTLDEVSVVAAVARLLNSDAIRASARRLASMFAAYDSRAIFRSWTDRIVTDIGKRRSR